MTIAELLLTGQQYRLDAESRRALDEYLERRMAVSYTHLRAHETVLDIVCRLLLEKKKKQL